MVNVPKLNGYKHTCLRRDSNLQTTVPNGNTLPFGYSLASMIMGWCNWFGALWSVFYYTRANYTGNSCLKLILNGYKHPYLLRDLNPQTTVLNGTSFAGR